MKIRIKVGKVKGKTPQHFWKRLSIVGKLLPLIYQRNVANKENCQGCSEMADDWVRTCRFPPFSIKTSLINL